MKQTSWSNENVTEGLLGQTLGNLLEPDMLIEFIIWNTLENDQIARCSIISYITRFSRSRWPLRGEPGTSLTRA